ncbi:hypothetical protein K2173_024198 [Erythroxylum novogranatense]|uniref:FAF domain-containing protein n=1 Tax=Erythroxylum novogranatense TaxID=1862640 RepID=A0AAV8UFR9_9ROSI|nr:hypothetical protein K2173_024198 [Erythroxylum novogranatense]
MLSTSSSNKQTLVRSESMSSLRDQSNPSKPPSNSTNSVAQLLDDLSLEKNPSSPGHQITVPFPISSTKLSSSSNDPPENSTNDAEDSAKAEKKRIMNNTCLYLGKSPANDDAIRFFPPPISSLKLVKKGAPVVYIECSRDENRFTLSEVSIPAGDMLVASRESGRLKLYFAPPQDEENDDEAEEN